MDKCSADDALQRALTRDDPGAVEMIWDRYAGDLLALLLSMLYSRQDAEDVLQTVFVRIVRNRRKVAKARCLDAYVWQIARNEACAFLRKRQRRQDARLGDEAWLVAAHGKDAQPELAEQVQHALTRLPSSQREVIVLKLYRERTFVEIAERLGISPNTAASRYRYGLEKLRTLLKDFIS